MKNLKLILLLAIAGIFFLIVPDSAQAQRQKGKKHKIVFDVSVGGEEAWRGVLNNVENLQKSFGQSASEIEVVLHGKGLGMILKTNANQQERLKMLSNRGIVFAAGSNSRNITSSNR